MLQSWTEATSSETRLLVTDKYSSVSYNGKLYEDVMFYFDIMTRTAYYHFDNKKDCHCHDCSVEKIILGKYFLPIEEYPHISRAEIEF